MKKYSIITLLLLAMTNPRPVFAQVQINTFTSPSPLPVSTISSLPAKFTQVSAGIRNDKVILDWTVRENETADLFEIEKSIDGKNFTTAALVFGTDDAKADNYQFYEKVVKQKTLYRIKLINKNKQTEYSKVIEVDPEIINHN